MVDKRQKIHDLRLIHSECLQKQVSNCKNRVRASHTSKDKRRKRIKKKTREERELKKQTGTRLKRKDCKHITRAMKWYLKNRQTIIYQKRPRFLPLLSTHHSSIRLTSLLLNSLNRSFIAIHGFKFVDISIQLRISSRVDNLQSLLTSLQRERHQNVNSSELVAAKKTSSIRRSGQLRFQKVKVGFEVWPEVHGFEFAVDAAGDGTEEEGNFVAFEDCRRW